jgi:hypothetical protein
MTIENLNKLISRRDKLFNKLNEIDLYIKHVDAIQRFVIEYDDPSNPAVDHAVALTEEKDRYLWNIASKPAFANVKEAYTTGLKMVKNETESQIIRLNAIIKEAESVLAAISEKVA